MAQSFLSRFISLILFFLIAISSLHADENPFDLPPDAFSAAHSDGGFSMLINPAFSGLRSHSLFAYRYYGIDGEDDGSHFLMTNFLGISVTYAWYEKVLDDESDSIIDANTRYFHFSKGFSLRNIFLFGLSYSLSSSDTAGFDDYKAWQFGFLYRPYSFLSLGLSFNDVGAQIDGQSIKRHEIYSLGFRPFTDRITFTVDGKRYEGGDYSDMDYSYSAELRFMYDISFFARSDFKDNVYFGAKIPLFFRSSNDGLNLDYYRSYDNKPKNFSSVGLVIPREDYKNALPGAMARSSEENLLFMKINRPIRENEVASFFQSRDITFYDIVKGVESGSTDSTIDALVLQIDSAEMGFAQLQELRHQLQLFKQKGKRVYVLITQAGNKEYYLASVADKIYIAPNANLFLTGLKAQFYFFQGLLGKAGVQFESVKKGKYKSFNESFTRKNMSPEFRENMKTLLADLNRQYISDVVKARNLSQEKMKLIFAKGFLAPKEAQNLGLVDVISYPQEALEKISKNGSRITMREYLKDEVKNYAWGALPHIAIVHVGGSIVRGKTSGRSASSATGDETYENMIKQVFKDPLIRGVVIRVNSGGGSALASDQMWKSLIYWKKKYPKPVVFSFGNIAASGGYYLACTGDAIFASQGTITGSIGVVSGKISIKELYSKLGINKEIIKESEFADIFSESREWTEKEKRVMQRSVDFIYNRFTGKVAKARKISPKDIENVAEGRVFTGGQAKEKKLVNKMGGLMTALAYIKSRARLRGDIKVVVLPDERTYSLDMFQAPEVKLLAKHFKELIDTIEFAKYRDENVLYIVPYKIEIK